MKSYTTPFNRRVARAAGRIQARRFLLTLALNAGDKAAARNYRRSIARYERQIRSWAEWNVLAQQYVVELGLNQQEG